MIVLPVSILVVDASLLLNPFLLSVILGAMAIFGLLAYFLFIRPYFLYQKMPEVLVETDGEYVYIYGKKEAKIPLSDFDGAMVTYELPFIFSSEFLMLFLAYFLSEKYGDLVLDVPGYGSYKLHFVANVKASADDFLSFLNAELNKN